jgi:hypothetical protein
MSGRAGTEIEALPAQPDEAQISSLVSSIVLKAKEGDSLRCVLHKARFGILRDHEPRRYAQLLNTTTRAFRG